MLIAFALFLTILFFRGDLTIADSYLVVLPPHTDCVIFSIDGSFAASVSLMGSDPKVQPGSVDVVRYGNIKHDRGIGLPIEVLAVHLQTGLPQRIGLLHGLRLPAIGMFSIFQLK